MILEDFEQQNKMVCPNCGKRLDISDLEPFEEFNCLLCGKTLKKLVYFERYILLNLCGIGGMSRVYHAIDSQDGKDVAIKITNNEIFEDNADGERFTFEADLVSRIDHPGIVKVYRGGIHNHQAFLVMEFMKKGSLETMQKSFMLPPADKILSWLAVIASGLYEAYKLGIVHHDIKPANIMLSEDGEVKIGDFDLAEISLDGMHESESTFASLPYVSPERLLNGSEDASGDIFSLGVSAYELLTGEYPFGNQGEIEELLERRKHPKYLAVNVLNSTVSRSVSNLIERMMSYNVEDRPSYQEIINSFDGGKGEQLKSYTKTISGKFSSWFKK